MRCSICGPGRNARKLRTACNTRHKRMGSCCGTFPAIPGTSSPRQDGWNHVKLVVSGRRMNIFINGATDPRLAIGSLEGDADEGGTDVARPWHFCRPHGHSGRCRRPTRRPGNRPQHPMAAMCGTGSSRHTQSWQRTRHLPLPILPSPQPDGHHSKPSAAGLANASRVYGLPLASSGPCRYLAEDHHSLRSAQQKHVSLGGRARYLSS